ncbi:MAG: hypothetical protein KAH48_02390, partial [Chlorobi bacterium]|nr:hypothetical protein [Chlorobiota bacterium]
MKKNLKLATMILAAALTVTSCASTSSNDYYGYNNTPVTGYEAQTYAGRGQLIEDQNNNEGWSNPLSENYDEANYVSESQYGNQVVYYNASSPMYVPVIIPWWHRYNDWLYSPGFSIYASYHRGWYSGYNWYSPFYDYHPYYGWSWPHRHYYGGYYGHHYNDWYYRGHHSWWHQPRYGYSHNRYVSSRPRSVRRFGPSRGSVSDYNRNSRRSTVASSRYASNTRSSRDASSRASLRSSVSSRSAASPSSVSTRSSRLTSSLNANSTRSSRNTGTVNSTRSTRSSTANNSTYTRSSRTSNNTKASGSTRSSGRSSRSSMYRSTKPSS